jgi:hypothetical protein
VPAWLLTVLEVVFLAAAVAGIALLSIPAALIAGGVAGAVMCEWADIQRKARKARDAQ